MSKWAPDAMMEAGLAYVRANANKMIACSAQPTTYAEANATYALADVAMTVSTDYTLADGTSGRKITVAAKSDVDVDAAGTATHIALVSTGDSTLRYVTTCTSQALALGNKVNFPAWDIQINDPS
jgi:hypothetical protein